MTNTKPVNTSRLKLFLYMWIAGMLGVVVITVMVVPQLVADIALPMPLWVMLLVSSVQSALFVALAVWLGVVLAPRVGLRATVFEAAVTSGSISKALRPQLFPGLVAGFLGGIALYAIGGYASPAELANAAQQFTVPILARVLYGGITEELLLRWGLMTVLLWLSWRFLQRGKGAPKLMYIWLAIIVSALLFGAGHLPAATMQVGELTAYIVLFVVGANAIFGLLFGYLYWRHGLEAAMIAHFTAHVVSYALGAT